MAWIPPRCFSGSRPIQTAQSNLERRISPRIACALETSCRLLGPRNHNAIRARVLDVSTGGLALWLMRWYDSGTFLAIDLPFEKGNPALHQSVVRVQYAVPQGEAWWMVGAAFARHHRPDEIKAML